MGLSLSYTALHWKQHVDAAASCLAGTGTAIALALISTASTGVVMTPGMLLSTGVAHVGDRRTDGITIDNRTI